MESWEKEKLNNLAFQVITIEAVARKCSLKLVSAILYQIFISD